MVYKFSIEQFRAMYRDLDSATYQEILQQKAAQGQPDKVTVLVDASKLREAFRDLLAAYCQPHNIPVDGKAISWREKQQQEESAVQAKVVADTANKRMSEWVQEGLLNVEYNRSLIDAWFETNRAAWTAHNIDVAVGALSSQIQWAVWSKHAPGANPVAPVAEETTEPKGLAALSKKQIIEKLRADREERERFVQRYGLAAINARLAEPEPAEVPAT